MTKLKSIMGAGLVALSISSQFTFSAVSSDQAAKLNNELTPFGAERAGNTDGTIPTWNGGLNSVPKGLSYAGGGQHHADPYAEDAVLFTITAENMDQYADKLTEGQKALFNAYPDSFKMPVYPTRRSHAAPDWVYKNTYDNALNAELVDDGNSVENAFGGIPFPIPQTGQEVIWNHLLRWKGTYREFEDDWFGVMKNGSKSYESQSWIEKFPYYVDRKALDASPIPESIISTVLWTAPARKKGELLLIRDAIDQSKSPRRAWQYLPGTRRIRRAPTVAYDTPQGPGGLRAADDTLGFNGAIDRYNWELVGKKEVYIPYNSYKLESNKVTYDDLLANGHLNPVYMRWELHRVWVVKAELKGGARHVYKSRTLYLDEDSWVIALADNYDGRGELWRTNVSALKNYYELPGTLGEVIVFHDLNSRAYQVTGLKNERRHSIKYNVAAKEDSFFTPQNARKMSLR